MSGKGIQEEAGKHAAVIEVVSGIAEICLQHRSADEAYQQLLGKLKELINFDAATVFVATGDDAKLHQAASVGGVVEVLDFLSLERGDGLSGWTADSGRPIVLSDRSVHRDFDPAADYASFMSIPLVVNKDVVGVINFGSKKPGTYSSTDAELASLVVSQIVLALETLELRRQKKELERLLSELRSQLKEREPEANLPGRPENIREFIGRINHDINNSLAILVGNVQCMQMEKDIVNQKTLSRLKRMERALLKVNEANHKMLQLIPSRNAEAAASEDNSSTEETITTNA